MIKNVSKIIKINRMNKKGVDLLAENIVYIVVAVLFLSSMFFSVTLVGRQVTLYEQVYAKQIVLMIDKAEPGMDIEYRDFRMFKLAADNNAPREIVSVDNDRNVVIVRLSNGLGYNYEFFNDVRVVPNIVHKDNVISLKVVESTGGLENENVG